MVSMVASRAVYPLTKMAKYDKATKGLDSFVYIMRHLLGYCPGGGIGRRARLKIWYRKVYRFDSGLGHQ